MDSHLSFDTFVKINSELGETESVDDDIFVDELTFVDFDELQEEAEEWAERQREKDEF